MLFNEIYPPNFEKKKKKFSLRTFHISNSEQSTKKEGKDKIVTLPFNSKTHATLNKKIFVNLYAKDLFFLTTCADWKVTKIYDHYTFRQVRLKRDFVVMNQNAQKTAKTKVEKDFYKLFNNSNFGNNCRNNIGNSTLELIFDGHEEIIYLKKFTNIMKDSKFREIFSLDLLRKNVEHEYKIQKRKAGQKRTLLLCTYGKPEPKTRGKFGGY